MDTVCITDVLHALSDPVRLAIVRALLESEAGTSCVETMQRAAIDLPKSTCSQHYQILRESGVIHCERKGVELSSRVRREELDSRFPGLLTAILEAASRS